jgi:hypothetical protein
MTTMSNSPLVTYTKLSPNFTKGRTRAIDTITIHCMAGNLSVEVCGNVFAPTSRRASSNYGIGSDGRIALYVDEANRSWCTSSSANDSRAVTIEVANTAAAHPWPVSDKALAALIDLCTDICKRNNIKRLLWEGNKALIGQVDRQNMTAHRWFAAKACPGDYLFERHSYIAAEVNKRLGAVVVTPTAPSVPSVVVDTAKVIWDFFMGKGLTAAGTAGLMGNLSAESGLLPNNLRTLSRGNSVTATRHTPPPWTAASIRALYGTRQGTASHSGRTGAANKPCSTLHGRRARLSAILRCSLISCGKSCKGTPALCRY